MGGGKEERDEVSQRDHWEGRLMRCKQDKREALGLERGGEAEAGRETPFWSWTTVQASNTQSATQLTLSEGLQEKPLTPLKDLQSGNNFYKVD